LACPATASLVKNDLASGFRGFASHARNNHESILQDTCDKYYGLEECDRSQSLLTNWLVQTFHKDSKKYFGWINFMVHCRLPYTICEDPVYRANCPGLGIICRASLRNVLTTVGDAVNITLTNILPDNFCLIFDG